MSDSIARLVVRQGSSSQQEYSLPEHNVVIGRESVNDIVFQDPEISRRHSRISYQAGGYLIEDLGSTNGTKVNGRPISAAIPLRNGDIIALGDSVSLVFYGPGDAAGETVVESGPQDLGMETVVDFGDANATQYEAPLATPRYEPPPAGPRYEPPPDPVPAPEWQADPYQVPSPESLAPAMEEERDRRRIYIGCGCLLFLAIVACGASVFLLDSLAPDTLYCGPLRPVFELFGFALNCG